MSLRINKNEDGIVAIVVTMIVLLVITITSVGFARLANREQRQALDKQLSSEAFYAAESGVNDIVNGIKTGVISTAVDKNDCLPDPAVANSPKFSLLSTTSAHPLRTVYLGNISAESEYTCTLYTVRPPTLDFTSVGTEQSKYANITFTNSAGVAQNAGQLVIGWRNVGPATSFRPAGSSDFQTAVTWGSTTGILRVDITNLAPGFNRTALNNNTMTLFLYPNDGSQNSFASQAFVAGRPDSGVIVNGGCNTTTVVTANTARHCNAVIDLSALGSSRFFVRMKSIYNDTAVSLKSTNSTHRLSGAQAQIDVTGKANDVLRRLQIKIPLDSSDSLADFAVESVDSICKRLATKPNDTQTDKPLLNECQP